MPTQLARAISEARAVAPSRNPLASLRGRLVLVTSVLVATAALMAVALLADAAHRRRSGAVQQLSDSAHALSQAVDGRIVQAQAVLQALGASPALAAGDLKAFELQARGSLSDSDGWIELFDPAGRAMIDTVLPAGNVSPDFVNASAASRLGDLQRTGDGVGDLTMGPKGRRYLLHLDHLVRVRGQPFDLMMVLTPEALQKLMAPQNLPAGWYASIVDGQGRIIARNIEPQRWVGARSSVPPSKLHAAPAGVFESVARDGVMTLAGYRRSGRTGWTSYVAMPRYEATGGLEQSLQWLSLICAVLLALGAAMTVWFMRGLAGAVRRLETFAEALGREVPETPRLLPTGLRETDFIAEALGAAAERIREREHELQRINENLEVRVAEASARLIQAQKVEAIGRLTGGVAHDFNNLLTAVIGNLELLRRKLTEERLLQFVDNARSAADRGAKLTGQLLAFARRQALTREAVDVNGLILGMVELLTSSVGAGIAIDTEFDPDIPLALADRTQLEMVVLNLVINARDALPSGGLIRILTGRERVERASDRPEHPPVGDFVTIGVADDGIGIAPEMMDQVLEPFFTTKPPGRGSGLGLSQALGVAQQLGGGLRIASRLGLGAEVRVYLPLAPVPSRTGTPRTLATES